MGKRKNGEGTSWGPDSKGYYHFSVMTDIITKGLTQHRIHTTSKISAEDAIRKGLKKKKEKEYADKHPKSRNGLNQKSPFQKWVREYIEYREKYDETARRWAGSTALSNETLMRRFFNSKLPVVNMPIYRIEVKHFIDFYREISEPSEDLEGKPVNINTRKHIRNILIGTIEYAKRYGVLLLNGNPAADAKIPSTKVDELPADYKGEEKVKDVLTDDDIKKLWAGAQSHLYRYGGAYALMLSSGIRSEEIKALRKDDIEIAEDGLSGRMEITKALGKRRNKETGKYEYYVKTTKNSDVRTIYLDELGVKCVRLIEQDMFLKSPKIESPLLIYTPQGYYVKNGFADTFRLFCEHFGIYLPLKKGPHILRHTFISYNNVKSGVNPILTAAVAGHRDLGVDINVYSHANEETIRQNIKNPLEAAEEKTKVTEEKKEENESIDEMLARLPQEDKNRLLELLNKAKSKN